MESYRVQRVEKEIREITSSYIVSRLSHGMGGFVTITRVICSRDLKNAKILVHTFDGKLQTEQSAKFLQDHANEIQRELNTQLRMKYCPRLTFIVDEKYEEALKVQEELRKLELERRASQESEKVH